jgi:predicted MFS family arabinose efflux permease
MLINKKQILLYFLALVNFVHIMDFMIMMPLGELFMRIFDITPRQFSAVVSSYTLAAGVSGFIGAFWIDRFDRRPALLFTFIGFMIGTFSCALAYDFFTLMLTRGITGIFGGVTTALIISIASDMFPYQQRGYAMGILTAAFSVAAVAGVPFGLFMANQFDWHAPFIIMGFLSIFILIVLWKIMPDMPASDKGKSSGPLRVLQNIIQDKNQLNALLLGFIIVLGHFMIIPFITPYLIRNAGFSDEHIPWVYMIGGGFTIFTAPYFGRLTDRIGAIKVFTILLLISFIPVLWLTNLPSVSLLTGLTVTSLFFIFGSGRMIPAQTLITGAVSSETRGSFMSFRSSVQQLATSIAAIISGLIVLERADGTLEGYIWVGVAAVLISLLALPVARLIKIVD